MNQTRMRFVAFRAALASLSILSIAALTGAARAQDAPVQPPANPAPPVAVPVQPPTDELATPKGPDITDKAIGDKRLKRLVSALQSAGLVETLKGKGPFTVFAPVDAAFNKIPQSDWDNLLKPENKEKLAAILKYHVVSGKLTSADVAKLKDGDTLTTLQGGKLTVHIVGNKIKIGDADIVKTDIEASNGVIHQINAVLIPPPEPAPADAPPAAPEPAPAPEPPPAPQNP